MTDFDDTQWILVVDDEPAVRAFIERALNYAGYGVYAAADANEALSALQKKKYDLMLTDIVMPDMDGIALALKVSKDFPEMKILMMTGYAHQKDRAHNLDFLVSQVILKPFSLDEITQKVALALKT
jgi:DNA-binding response OmpR family regulator